MICLFVFHNEQPSTNQVVKYTVIVMFLLSTAHIVSTPPATHFRLDPTDHPLAVTPGRNHRVGSPLHSVQTEPHYSDVAVRRLQVTPSRFLRCAANSTRAVLQQQGRTFEPCEQVHLWR